MSETYGTFKARVRNLLNDIGPGNYVVSEERLRELTAAQVQLIGQHVNPGTQWLSPALTITAGTGDYAFSTTVQYAQVIAVHRGSDHFPLAKRTVAEQDAFWVGKQIAQGPLVFDYAIWEDDSQKLNIRVRPVPTANDTLEVHYSDLPLAITSDAVTVPFSGPLIAALAKQVAIDAAAIMSEADAEQLHIDKAGLVQVWAPQVARAISDEISRLNTLKRQDRMIRVDR